MQAFSGCGTELTVDTNYIIHKLWRGNEIKKKKKNSTWRELEAVNCSLKSFKSLLEGAHVKCYTDNRAENLEIEWILEPKSNKLMQSVV